MVKPLHKNMYKKYEGGEIFIFCLAEYSPLQFCKLGPLIDFQRHWLSLNKPWHGSFTEWNKTYTIVKTDVISFWETTYFLKWKKILSTHPLFFNAFRSTVPTVGTPGNVQQKNNLLVITRLLILFTLHFCSLCDTKRCA